MPIGPALHIAAHTPLTTQCAENMARLRHHSANRQAAEFYERPQTSRCLSRMFAGTKVRVTEPLVTRELPMGVGSVRV